MGKRGPARQAGRRDASGHHSRKKADITKRLAGNLDLTERDALRVGVEARHRVFGALPEQCRDQRLGSFVGRLSMAGELTDGQYEAAMQYLGVYHAMAAAVDAPRQPGAVNLNATKGAANYEDIERSRRAMAAWRAAQDAVQRRQNELRGQGALIAALRSCVIEDREFPHMVEWLRQALIALATHFQIGDKRRNAA